MVTKTSRCILFYCALGWLGGLVGCTSVAPLQVYEDQYIVDRLTADGPFNPWKVGVKDTAQLPAGVYDIHATGRYELVSTKLGIRSRAEPVDYDTQADLCLTGELQKLPCSPNYVLSTQTNDPDFSKLWGLKESPGLNITSILTDKRTPDVKIMVLDTGVSEHEDLKLAKLSYNAVTGSTALGDARDDNGHGSHVSGTIGAIGNNGKGITGVSEEASIIPGKFLTANGSGSLYNAIRAVRWAVDNDVDIINASFGGGGYSPPFQTAINEAADKGVLIIAAAGNNKNDNDKKPHYPSNYNNVLSVASVDRTGKLSWFSNYGEDTVDIAAPGSDIYSVNFSGGYTSLSGTSMATPHVAGLAAIVYQRNQHLPKKDRRELTWRLLTEGVHPLERVKFGLIDADKVLATKCKRRKLKQCKRECRQEFNCN